MRLWAQLSVVIALACAVPSVLAARLIERTLQFPAAGMPYAQARILLLKQGLQIAPDKPSKPDDIFRELNCSNANLRSTCRALFIEKRSDGWRDYIVVDVDAKDKTVTSAGYPHTVDGLLSIPPPLPADIPQIEGSYLRARERLKQLGFRPAKKAGIQTKVCADTDCRREITLPEAECSGTGAGFCNTYWLAKNGRVLNVVTVGEINFKVYFVRWTTCKELRDFTGFHDCRPPGTIH